MIPLLEPTLDGNEARYLQECIDSGYVSSVGPFVERFEREFAKAVGAQHAVACASGTAALHVALRLAGAQPGTLVAVSDFTFIASANAISYTGADLLLVDSEPSTWNMNTEMLHDYVMSRARNGDQIPAIILVVHVLGHPAAVEPLLELKEKFDIKIVEDAAEALGAGWNSGRLADRQTGAIGDLGCFSFNGNKMITTGGGGMLVTRDAQMSARARHLTTQARTSSAGYWHDDIGYNYRLTNIAAALGLAQMERLSNILERKKEIAKRYNEYFRGAELVPMPKAAWADPSYWLYSLLVPEHYSCRKLGAEMAGYGISTRRLWPPLHKQLPYANCRRLDGIVAEGIYNRGVSLPSSAHLTKYDQLTIATKLKSVLLPTGGRITSERAQ